MSGPLPGNRTGLGAAFGAGLGVLIGAQRRKGK